MNDFNYKNLTFLLLVKDRPQFLKRWIKFHIHKNYNVNIFIADGGKKSILNDDLKRINNKKNIRYQKYEYDKDYKSFIKKVLLSLKKIKTKYVLFCSDDDFLNFNAILNAKKILEQQKYISAITGRYISFQGYNKFNRIFSHPSGLSFMYDKKCIFYKDRYKRIKNFFNKHPFGLFHYMMPTKILRGAYQAAINAKIYNADLCDLFVNIYVYSKVKIIKRKDVFHMHQYHHNSEAHNRSYKVLLNKKYESEINEIAKILSKKINIETNKLRNDVLNFIKRGSKEKKANMFIVKLKNIILNKLTFKFFERYYFNKSIIEKNNFKKKLNKVDISFIENVYSFFRLYIK